MVWNKGLTKNTDDRIKKCSITFHINYKKGLHKAFSHKHTPEVKEKLSEIRCNYLNNNRQIALMNKAYNSLLNAKEATEALVDISLIEIDIKDAFDALGEITGESYPEELITALFTKFCLGK